MKSIREVNKSIEIYVKEERGRKNARQERKAKEGRK